MNHYRHANTGKVYVIVQQEASSFNVTVYQNIETGHVLVLLPQDSMWGQLEVLKLVEETQAQEYSDMCGEDAPRLTLKEERVLFEKTMAPEFPDAPKSHIDFGWWLWKRARSLEDGECESCIGDKCRTGYKCVTLDRDSIEPVMEHLTAQMPRSTYRTYFIEQARPDLFRIYRPTGSYAGQKKDLRSATAFIDVCWETGSY